jgi:predicted DNA-binding mobile mystery protein A
MNTANKRLILEQLNNRMNTLSKMEHYALMPDGWIYTIRKTLNISLRQLALKLGVTPQNVKKLEHGEKVGSISLKKLKEIADALDMKLVYVLIPKDGSLEKLIEKKAAKKAEEIVRRTSHTMSLEDQENSKMRLKKAIQQKIEMIIRELPKYLWD